VQEFIRVAVLTKSWKRAKLKSRHVKITLKTNDSGSEEQGYEKRALEPPNDMAMASAFFIKGLMPAIQ